MIKSQSNKCSSSLYWTSFVLVTLQLTGILWQVDCLSTKQIDHDGNEATRNDIMNTAESALAGAAAGGVGAGKAAFSNGGAAGFNSASNGAAGFASSGGKKVNFSKGAANKASGFKNAGKKAAIASSTGYASKFGKKAGKYKSFAAGHKKVFGTIKTFHHKSGFKFGSMGSYGALGGASKGFVNKKAFGSSNAAAGFNKSNKGASKGVAIGGSTKVAFQKAAKGSTGFKSAGASEGSSGIAKGAVGAIGGVAG